MGKFIETEVWEETAVAMVFPRKSDITNAGKQQETGLD